MLQKEKNHSIAAIKYLNYFTNRFKEKRKRKERKQITASIHSFIRKSSKRQLIN